MWEGEGEDLSEDRELLERVFAYEASGDGGEAGRVGAEEGVRATASNVALLVAENIHLPR